MSSPRSTPRSPVVIAMLCAGVVTAQFVAGKATRDALFLTHLPVTTLPTMVMATAIFSVGLVTLSSKSVARLTPARLVPVMFAANAFMLLAEWMLTFAAPKVAAVLVYLQIAGLGPMLGSGFWLLATERFDPRTAKRRFGQIAGAGTIGGLLGGLLAERVGVILNTAAMLPILAALNVFCAWQIHHLAWLPGARLRPVEFSPDLAPEPPRSGLRVLAEAPYLRHLAVLVVLGTTAAALVDYVFKVQAVAAVGSEEGLIRFFSAYYAGTSLITFVVQTSVSRLVLERFGLAFTTSTPSLALLLGGIGSLFAPGLQGMMIARGGEAVFRGSLFRAGYELFYTPLPPGERRAAKSLIDVGFDRLGDAVAGGTIGLALLLLTPSVQSSAILSLAIVCSAVAVAVASRLNRGYILTLERSLLDRAVDFDLSDIEDATTRTTMLRTLHRPLASVPRGQGETGEPAPPRPRVASIPVGVDPEIHEIVALRSRDRERILGVLRDEKELPASLVPHVIPLLAWDPVADDAVRSLRVVAEQRVGELTDALVDPNQDFTIRRRLARVLSSCRSQRGADGLLLGLEDQRFEVRFHCGRSLGSVLEKNPAIRLDKQHVLEVVSREVAVGKPVWESHRLLDRLDDRDHFVVDNFLRDRASQSLAHVFTLLSLVLPTEPLQIAFKGLHTDDPHLRGTALEYLEGVLPPGLRDRLWPFLEDHRPVGRVTRPREEILADLVRSNPSIQMNLEELKRRAADGQAAGPDLKGLRIR